MAPKNKDNSPPHHKKATKKKKVDNKSNKNKKSSGSKTNTDRTHPRVVVVKEKMYGDRSMRHHGIVLMSSDELHNAFPFVEDLVFNETMLKSQFNEKLVPDQSCIMGTKTTGKPHRFVIGNEAGEILPKLLNAKWIMIEGNVAFGRPLTITTTDEEKDKLYAMVREAQLRGIKPL